MKMRLWKSNSLNRFVTDIYFIVTKFCYSPAGIYLLKVNKRNTRTRCEKCSELTVKIPERRHWRRSGIFIVNFEHISHYVLVSLLLILSS